MLPRSARSIVYRRHNIDHQDTKAQRIIGFLVSWRFNTVLRIAVAVEFSRDITFGQYLDLRSPIHRLDPRAKLLAVAVLMLATFLVRSSFAGYAVLFLAAALIQSVSRVPLGYMLRGMRLLFNTMLIIFVFQVLFFPSPSESGTL